MPKPDDIDQQCRPVIESYHDEVSRLKPPPVPDVAAFNRDLLVLLQSEPQDLILRLARLLNDLAVSSYESPDLLDRPAVKELGELGTTNPAFAQMLGKLVGYQVPLAEPVVSFGKGNQFGDITVGYIAGGNVINITLNLTSSPAVSRPLGAPAFTPPARPQHVTSRDFLAAWGVISAQDSDFFATKAEQMRGKLPSAFVQGPLTNENGDERHVRDLAERLTQRRSVILFGGGGYGKTSYQVVVANTLLSDRSRSFPIVIVPVNVNGFFNLPRSELDDRTEEYIKVLSKKVVDIFENLSDRNPLCSDKLPGDTDAQRRYRDLEQSAKSAKLDRSLLKPPKGTSYYEQMTRLFSIARDAKFDRVYIFIDGFETFVQHKGRLPLVVTMLETLFRPITGEDTGFSYMFCLPDELEERLHDRVPRDLEFFKTYRLNPWNDELLGSLLKQRLTSFSHNPEFNKATVETLRQLCEPYVYDDLNEHADDIVIKEAGGSPSKLIEIIKAIVDEHCKRTRSVDRLISSETIRTILKKRQSGSR
jgi:hypothetical protein